MKLGSRWVNGKELRRGYTTGTCAAAAAKAAAQMLFSGQEPESVEIDLPAGIRLALPVKEAKFSPEAASCAVQKDAGDDPDVTNGLFLVAEARPAKEGIVLRAGRGIGIVTRPGLPVEMGQPAINPVPRRMILQAVREVLPPGQGVEITLSIPGGEEVAGRTFNPRLGIKDGLSILGTTGIVEPMSEEALKDSLRLEMKVLAAGGEDRLILVPGNYGENFVRENLGISRKPAGRQSAGEDKQRMPAETPEIPAGTKSVSVIKMSNYVGYALQAAVQLGFTRILLVGDIGKLIKVSAGIFNTHSREADARMEIMAAYAGLLGAGSNVIKRILEANTTAYAMDILEEEKIQGIYPLVTERVSRRIRDYTGHRAVIGTVLFANSRGLLAMDETGRQLAEEFAHE